MLNCDEDTKKIPNEQKKVQGYLNDLTYFFFLRELYGNHINQAKMM